MSRELDWKIANIMGFEWDVICDGQVDVDPADTQTWFCQKCEARGLLNTITDRHFEEPPRYSTDMNAAMKAFSWLYYHPDNEFAEILLGFDRGKPAVITLTEFRFCMTGDTHAEAICLAIINKVFGA